MWKNNTDFAFANIQGMTLFQGIVFGLIQGLTEFLPISSSAHLILLPLFTGWDDPGLGFDVALHWGTLLAVLIYFRREMLNLGLGFFGFLKGNRAADNKLAWHITLATLPGALMGLLLEKHAETVFRSPWILSVTLSSMGLLLFLSDRRGKKNLSLTELGWKTALIVGMCQGLALVPGVSRSGITISTALILGLTRSDAVRFSFFLAVPITLGAGLLKIGYLIHNLNDPLIWTALLTSALSGLAAIHILITYVKTKSFTPFVLYRAALAAGLLLWLTVNQ